MNEPPLHPMQVEIFRNMDPEQKWNLTVQLIRSVRELKAAFLREQHPDWTEEDVQKELRNIFLRGTT